MPALDTDEIINVYSEDKPNKTGIITSIYTVLVKDVHDYYLGEHLNKEY